MFLLKIRKQGEPTGWSLADDDECEEMFDAWVADGYAVMSVKLDDSDTTRMIDPVLLEDYEP